MGLALVARATCVEHSRGRCAESFRLRRVVTVEVGPEHARVWLTVGVTPQAIELLHTAPAQAGLSPNENGLRAH